MTSLLHHLDPLRNKDYQGAISWWHHNRTSCQHLDVEPYGEIMSGLVLCPHCRCVLKLTDEMIDRSVQKLEVLMEKFSL